VGAVGVVLGICLAVWRGLDWQRTAHMQTLLERDLRIANLLLEREFSMGSTGWALDMAESAENKLGKGLAQEPESWSAVLGDVARVASRKGPQGRPMAALPNSAHARFLKDTFSTMLAPGIAYQISTATETVLQSDDFATASSRIHASAPVAGAGTEWRLEIRATQAYLAQGWHWIPEAVAVLLLAASLALGMIYDRLRTARAEHSTAHAALTEALASKKTLGDSLRACQRAEADAKTARMATARFLATMSHEIRTPLNAIFGMFQLSDAAETLPDKTRKQAAMGIEAARRLHRDLSNVLDISRLDAGGLRVRLEPTALPQLTQMWASSLEGYVMRANRPISFALELADDLPETIQVDAAALTQVVNNLMDNAVKFTETGSVTLRVFGQDEDLHVLVADTGVGIAQDRRETIFELFYQAEDGIERRFTGTGLGLAISRDLVSLMQGKIEMCDNHPHGMIFEITLPRALSSIMAQPAEVVSDPEQTVRL